MKQTRIVPSSSPVTTVVVSGTPHHYFHSEALGKCRAVLIAEHENLPQKALLEQKLDTLLEKARQTPLSDDSAYESVMEEIRKTRAKIWEIENS